MTSFSAGQKGSGVFYIGIGTGTLLVSLGRSDGDRSGIGKIGD